MKTIAIAFEGLKHGIHHFEYELSDDFFDYREESIIKKANLMAKVVLDKKDSFLILNFEIDGTAELTCDRCNEPFDYEMIFDFKIIVKFEDRENKVGDEDDVIYLPKTAKILEINEVLYDYITINIPIQVIHPNLDNGSSGCDPMILSKIEDLNFQKEETDPRWSKLMNLKTENK